MIGKGIGWIVTTVCAAIVGLVIGAVFRPEIEDYFDPLRLSLFAQDIGYSADNVQACQLGSLETIVRNVRDDTIVADNFTADESWRAAALTRTRVCSDHDPGIPAGSPLTLLENISQKFPGCFDSDFPSLWQEYVGGRDTYFYLAAPNSENSTPTAYSLCRTRFAQGEHTGNFLCRSQIPAYDEIYICVERTKLGDVAANGNDEVPQCPPQLLTELQFAHSDQCPASSRP